MIALDAAGNWLDLMIFAPLGVSILAAAAAQLRSGMFPRWISWLGVSTGVAGIAPGLAAAPAFAAGPRAFGTVQILSFAIFGFWVWMLATGILLFRRAPNRAR